jgi:hypothetical protein
MIIYKTIIQKLDYKSGIREKFLQDEHALISIFMSKHTHTNHAQEISCGT